MKRSWPGLLRYVSESECSLFHVYFLILQQPVDKKYFTRLLLWSFKNRNSSSFLSLNLLKKTFSLTGTSVYSLVSSSNSCNSSSLTFNWSNSEALKILNRLKKAQCSRNNYLTVFPTLRVYLIYHSHSLALLILHWISPPYHTWCKNVMQFDPNQWHAGNLQYLVQIWLVIFSTKIFLIK